jgi:hypothetical protein
MKRDKLGPALFYEASQTFLKIHTLGTVLSETQTHPTQPGLVRHSGARNGGPCTLAPVTAITLFRYHSSSGVALCHCTGTPNHSHWVCMSLQKHQMIHANTCRCPPDQLCTNPPSTRQVARPFPLRLGLDAGVLVYYTRLASMPQSAIQQRSAI